MNHLIYLYVTINFIKACINALCNNVKWRCLDYQDNMKEIFQRIPAELKKTPEYFKRKLPTVLTIIGRTWYLNHMKNNKPPINIPGLTKNEKMYRKN